MQLLERCPDTPTGTRLAAIIALFYRTGISTLEAKLLNGADLDFSPGVETVNVHGSKLMERRLALDPLALRHLTRWAATRTRLRLPDPDRSPFFCVVKGVTVGDAWNESSLRNEFRALSKAVLDKSVNPSDLRDTLTADLIVEQWPLPHI